MSQHYIIRQLATSPATYLTFFIVTLIVQIKDAQAYGEGAPARICESMLPSHGEQSMKADKMPFSISLDRKFIRGTGKIAIKVTSKDPSKYSLRGVLFIMKQPNNKFKSFGTFDPTNSAKDLKTVACFGREGSGITHSHREPKTMLTFQWIAPNDTSAEYELHATLVRDFNSFWADYIYPDKIRVSVNAPASAGIPGLFTPLLVLAAVAFFFSDVTIGIF